MGKPEHRIADKKLAFAIADYVNEAVKYFGGTVAADIAAIVNNAGYAAFKDATEYTYSGAVESLSLGDAFTFATVRITGKPAFVFGLADGFAGTVTVTAGGVTETFEVAATDPRYIEFTGLAAYSFDSEITVVTTVGGEEIASGTYNLDTFVKYHKESGDAASEGVMALVDAFYRYVATAKAYRG